jgi:hypothetical protein
MKATPIAMDKFNRWDGKLKYEYLRAVISIVF